jgi:hypothetical protein
VSYLSAELFPGDKLPEWLNELSVVIYLSADWSWDQSIWGDEWSLGAERPELSDLPGKSYPSAEWSPNYELPEWQNDLPVMSYLSGRMISRWRAAWLAEWSLSSELPECWLILVPFYLNGCMISWWWATWVVEWPLSGEPHRLNDHSVMSHLSSWMISWWWASWTSNVNDTRTNTQSIRFLIFVSISNWNKYFRSRQKLQQKGTFLFTPGRIGTKRNVSLRSRMKLKQKGTFLFAPGKVERKGINPSV